MAEPTLFRWTGGPDQTEDPAWAVDAISAGDLEFINDGSPNVRLKVNATGQVARPGDCLALRDGTVRVVHAGVAPSGCLHCGIPAREHKQRWKPEPGWHKWTEPTQQQRKDRMLARRTERGEES